MKKSTGIVFIIILLKAAFSYCFRSLSVYLEFTDTLLTLPFISVTLARKHSLQFKIRTISEQKIAKTMRIRASFI